MATVAGGTVTMHSGVVIPRVGLGTWPMDDAEAERVIADAISAGYRLIDTAENYGNEAGVGAGVRASGIDRAEVFVTSKFNREWHSVDGVRQAFEASVQRLGLDYIDLFLIHWPNPDLDRFVEAWIGLISLKEQGLVRAIGTSNFNADHLSRIINESDVVPDLNQLRINPRYQQRELAAFNQGKGIFTQSWSPLGQGNDLLEQDVVVDVASRNGITPAQAVLAWHLSHGFGVVPKSSDPERLRLNLSAADITLPAADIALLDGMPQETTDLMPEIFGH